MASLNHGIWCAAGVYGYAAADGRPFAAASIKHGIVVGEVSLHSLPSHRQSEDGRSPSSIDKVTLHLSLFTNFYWYGSTAA